jgi:hypothetical protein
MPSSVQPECNQPLDGAPLIDGVERFARDVFDHGAHGAAILGRVGHDDLDLLELGGDRALGAAMAGLDDEAVAAIGLGERRQAAG